MADTKEIEKLDDLFGFGDVESTKKYEGIDREQLIRAIMNEVIEGFGYEKSLTMSAIVIKHVDGLMEELK